MFEAVLPPHPLPRRVSVVGTTGTGKTTMARRLGAALGAPVLELDAVHWGPNWEPHDPDDVLRQVMSVLDGESWVVDGNYSHLQDRVWERADTVVWLDYSFPVMFGRLIRRTLRRSLRRERLWSGNRETLWKAAFSRDSILRWQLQTFRKNRRRYRERSADPRWSHLRIVRLRAPEKSDALVAEVLRSTGGGAS